MKELNPKGIVSPWGECIRLWELDEGEIPHIAQVAIFRSDLPNTDDRHLITAFRSSKLENRSWQSSTPVSVVTQCLLWEINKLKDLHYNTLQSICEVIAAEPNEELKRQFELRIAEALSITKGWSMHEEKYADGQIKRTVVYANSDLEMNRKLAKLHETALKNGAVEVTQRKIGRNEQCPCKSGKKFKNCCLRLNQDFSTGIKVGETEMGTDVIVPNT